MITLEQAKDQLAFRQPFTANNLNAYWRVEDNGRMKYLVFSYAQLIASLDEEEGEWITDQKFSVTTSKHTNLVKKAWSE